MLDRIVLTGLCVGGIFIGRVSEVPTTSALALVIAALAAFAFVNPASK